MTVDAGNGQGSASVAGSGDPPERVGLVLHNPIRYDLRLWFMARGREGALRRELVELARLQAGERVLDVGCGTGSLAIAAKRRVGPDGAVHAIDPSPEMIGRARSKARRAKIDIVFEQAIAQTLPFADGSFDAVLSTFVLHQLPGEAIHRAVAEMRRVLRPGGRLLLVDIGGDQGERNTVHVRAAAQHHVHLFDLRDARPLLEHLDLDETASGDVGFRLSRFERVQYLLATAGR
jgi:ubiquinone/menaquinone biosynthesis C-methylase UbiE